MKQMIGRIARLEQQNGKVRPGLVIILADQDTTPEDIEAQIAARRLPVGFPAPQVIVIGQREDGPQ